MAQTVVDLVLKTSGLGKLAQVDKALKGVANEAFKAGTGVDRMAKAVGRVSGAGINNLAASFDRLKASADRAAASAKKAVVAASKSNAAKGIAAAGAFSALPGAGIAQSIGAGALVGGKTGAIAAGVAAIGAAAVKAGSDAAIFAAEISKLEVALKNVAGPDSAQALDAIRNVVDDFNTPIKEATQGFTGLAAATSAAGFSINETEQVYRSLAAANKALGGDVNKLNGILLAAQQVFSKGKVSAEELRGQIGERLPGAFAEFAAATGRSTQQLDKALNDGEVTLDDFVKFSERLLKKYEEDAKKIADGPEEAGARLQTALSDLQRNVGTLLGPIGAAFQNTFTAIIKIINGAIVALNQFLGIGTANAIAKVEGQIAEAESRLGKNNGRNDFRIESRLRASRAELAVLKERQKAEDAALKANTPKPVAIPTPTGTRTTTGGGTTRKSQVEARQRELDLALALEDLQGKINAAELAGNDQLKIRLEGQAKMYELLKKEGDIKDEEIPNAEKQLKLLTLGVEVRMQALATEQQLALLAKSELEARQNALAPLEEQRTYLEDILSYGQDEADIRKQINQIMESTPGLDKDRVEELVRGNQVLQERIDKFKEMKAQVTAVASTISGAFTSAFRSIVDGSKSTSEALSDAFTKIGDSFVNMALKIIEQQLTMIMQGLLMKALGISMPGSGAGLPAGGGFGASAGSLSTGGGIFNTPFQTFADGGIPPVGKPSIVGEEGPEIFIPQERGLILPNDVFEATREALGDADGVMADADAEDAETVNSYQTNNQVIQQQAKDAAQREKEIIQQQQVAEASEQNVQSINNSYSSVSSIANSSETSAFSANRSSIESAYFANQRNIENQLTATKEASQSQEMREMFNVPNDPIRVSYETMNVGDMPVVTPQELERSTRLAAQKGRDMALASLKNSVRARKQVGLS